MTLDNPSASAPGDSRSPFVRAAELLAGIEPGAAPISLAVGEPQHPVPDFVGPVLARSVADFGRYPPGKGTDRFREAAAGWLGRRYALPRPVDANSEVVVLNGTREGLFLAAIMARRLVRERAGDPAVLVPNPFYAAYAAGTLAAGCEPVYLRCERGTGFLPDFDAVPDALLARTVAVYLATPSNPQGAVASAEYLRNLIARLRRFGCFLFVDECYSEIYTRAAPSGALAACDGDFSQVIVFHSLSKRSNLPGLRVGFAAGDAAFLAPFTEFRNVAAPQVPIPAQEVAVAAYADEAHVEANRALYAEKYDIADRLIAGRYGYKRPDGGFFLWLDVSRVGGDEASTVRLWKEGGVRVLPGRYLGREDAGGHNPGMNYIRVAMVHDVATTTEALQRLVTVLGDG